MRDEVYNWGSFLQSRMYAAGVTCSDCHDAARPEGQGRGGRRLLVLPPARAVREPQAPLPPGEGKGRLVRRLPPAHGDVHGGRPAARPLLPGAAARPHGGARPRERPERLQRLPPRPLAAVGGAGGAPVVPRRAAGEAALRRRPARGPDLPAGRGAGAPRGDPRPEASPASSAAPRCRSCPPHLGPDSLPALEKAATDPDPLVRLGAATTLEALPPKERVRIGVHLLWDPVRAVRVEAVTAFADVPDAELATEARAAFDRSLDDFVLAQRSNAERPESHVNLGIVNVKRGRLEEARRDYDAALRLAPWFVPAYVNLADLLRLQGRDDEGEKLLRRRPAGRPDERLGAPRARPAARAAKRPGEALAELGRAAELAPGTPDFAYAYAIGLHSAGRADEALAVLRAAQRAQPRRARPARGARHHPPRARGPARGAGLGAEARGGGARRPVRPRSGRVARARRGGRGAVD